MFVTPQEVYVYLRSLGVSEASAAGILVNIQFESSFEYTNDTGDNGTSAGLFQHHLGRWDNLKAYAISRGTTWNADWRIQVDFALIEARQMGINLQSNDAQAATKEWTIRFERPQDSKVKAEQRTQSVSQYMYGDPGNMNVTLSGNAAPQVGNETLNLPEGGSWFQVGGGYFVAFRFYGNDNKEGPSAVVYYLATFPPPEGTKIHSETAWNTYSSGWVDGGTTDTFRGVPAGKSYQDLVNDLLLQLGLAGTDALQDAGIMGVIALAMTRQMSEAELKNRLQQTEWWNSRTDKQREWNDLSDAEKALRVVDEASKMAGLWFTYVGVDLQLAQFDVDGDGTLSSDELRRGNPDLYDWASRVASGEVSQVTAVNMWMKDKALENPESPWSRTVRDEEKAQLQHGVDIENTGGQIRDLYNQWGVPISDERADSLAEQVELNLMSFEDVEEELSAQAQALYPNKPENMPTMEWAQPYVQTYMQTLEVPNMGLTDPVLNRALADGTNLADFRVGLRNDDRWLETQNAKDEMNTTISQLGRTMGF